jgi:hypothetical protein
MRVSLLVLHRSDGAQKRVLVLQKTASQVLRDIYAESFGGKVGQRFLISGET